LSVSNKEYDDDDDDDDDGNFEPFSSTYEWLPLYERERTYLKKLTSGSQTGQNSATRKDVAG